MTDPNQYLLAFERNCPHVRMTSDERQELMRLFNVAIHAAMIRTRKEERTA